MRESVATRKTAGNVATAEQTAPPAADAPAPDDSPLVLVPPPPAPAVEESEALDSIKLDVATLARLDREVADYVVAITRLRVKDRKFRARLLNVRKLGWTDVNASAQVVSRLLDRPIGSPEDGGLAVPETVSAGLLALRRHIESLDPGRQGDLFEQRKLLGLIPVGDPLQTYFARYQSGQSEIRETLAGLDRSRDVLSKDNVDLDRRKENLRQTTARLREDVVLAQKLDASLTERIAKAEPADPERAGILRDDMQVHARRRVRDLAAQLIASLQGLLSIDVVRANNQELIRGVERAKTDMVSALRTAVVAGQALCDQMLVLDQIPALKVAGPKAVPVAGDGQTPSTDLEKLQAAFNAVYATLDEIDAFRRNALDPLSRTIGTLMAQASRAQSPIEGARAGDAVAADGKSSAG